MLNKRSIGILLGLALFLTACFIPAADLALPGKITLGIFLLAAVFWITEPIPIFATSMVVILLQVFLLSNKGITRLFGNLSENSAAFFSQQSYEEFYHSLASPVIILFLGGFALAAAAVKHDFDKNLTRILLKPFGNKPGFVLLGLMVVTAVLSAFMSNTATTAMMITVVLPIIAGLKRSDPFRKAVALAIPVGANIGGIATPIGTPPNAIALSALVEQNITISFSTWMGLAVPLVVIMLLIAWRILIVLFPPAIERFEVEIDSRFSRSRPAMTTYAIFILTVSLWITEKLHGIPSTVIALLPVALLPASGVLDKQDIRRFSWEVLWLVAGGISLGISMQNTGLAEWLVGLVEWNLLGGFGLILVFGLVGYGIANLVSHTVSATILIPLAVSLGVSGTTGVSFNLGVGILTIGIIVSFSMILPISTPPNAIAMSTGMIETRDMAKVGVVVGFFGIILTMLFGFLIWPMAIN